MITGWFSLACLWATVVGSLVSLWLHLGTPWLRTALGRHLTAYIGITFVWYDLLLLGSLIGVPFWLEVTQVLVFAVIPLVIWWRAYLQIRARKHPLSNHVPADKTTTGAP